MFNVPKTSQQASIALFLALGVLVGCSTPPPMTQVENGKKQPINTAEWVAAKQAKFNEQKALYASSVHPDQNEVAAIYNANDQATRIVKKVAEVDPTLPQKNRDAKELVEAVKDAKQPTENVAKPVAKHHRSQANRVK